MICSVSFRFHLHPERAGHSMIQCACWVLSYHSGACRLALVEQGGFKLTKMYVWHIIHLTGKPIDRCQLSTPAKNQWKITVNFSQELDGYFFVLSWVSFLTLLTSVMMAHIIITNVNKSLYVTMLPPLSPNLGADLSGKAVLSAALISILYLFSFSLL